MPFLRTYVSPEDCARGFASAAVAEYRGFEVFFLAAANSFATEPTVDRLASLYGAAIPVKDERRYHKSPTASPISHAAAQSRLGWTPSTRWPLV